jgi:hypothetical protein
MMVGRRVEPLVASMVELTAEKKVVALADNWVVCWVVYLVELKAAPLVAQKAVKMVEAMVEALADLLVVM